MTTIVADKKSMAADRKITHGEQKFRAIKLRKIGESVVGCAGETAAIGKFLRWLQAGADNEEPPKFGKDDEMDALVLTPAGLFVYGTDCMPQEIVDPFYAIGSGAPSALAAMHMGADVKRAAEIACLVDNGSDGPVDVMTV